jgi:hypothetical protein
MQRKILAVVLYFIPIVIMIGLIPLISNDYVLTLIYIVFIIALMFIKSERHDWSALLLGLIGVTISEYIFISTGVEIFLRNSLFGLMPLWLPFLWSYVFVSIKRTLRILDR